MSVGHEKLRAMIIAFFTEYSFPQFSPLHISSWVKDTIEVRNTEKLVATIQILDETTVKIVCLFHYYPIFNELGAMLFKNGIHPKLFTPTNGKIKKEEG